MDRWRDFAACRGADPKIFWPDEKGSYIHEQEAHSYCERCPVRGACEEAAMRGPYKQGGEYGIWGGTSQNQRSRKMGKRYSKGKSKTALQMEAIAKRRAEKDAEIMRQLISFFPVPNSGINSLTNIGDPEPVIQLEDNSAEVTLISGHSTSHSTAPPSSHSAQS